MFMTWVSLADADVAFFYALDEDLKTLQEAGGGPPGTIRSVAGQQVVTFRIEGRLVHSVKMGTGCMQTARAAAAILARFPCDLVLSTGPAGRLSNRLKIAEWVRVAGCVAYQQGTETAVGFVRGRDALYHLAERLPVGLPDDLRTPRTITLASGEVFVASGLFRNQLQESTGADAVDMNLAGLAVACAGAKVPLFAWKVISDSADDSASADFQAFVKAYRGEGGRRMAGLIKALANDRSSPDAHPHLKGLLDSAAGGSR
jgi:adenosylhomocysteine nucleosidase